MPEIPVPHITFLGSKTIGNTLPQLKELVDDSYANFFSPTNPVQKALEDTRYELLGVRKNPLDGSDATPNDPNHKGKFDQAIEFAQNKKAEAQAAFDKVDEVRGKIKDLKNTFAQTGIYSYRIDGLPIADLGSSIQAAVAINDPEVAGDGITTGTVYGILIIGNDAVVKKVRQLMGLEP